jgi:integrase/recombinase XerD
MHLKYEHWFGNESSENILEAYGIVTKDNNQLSVLRPKSCPNCNEPNKPDSRFCAKCRMVSMYDAYNETIESEKLKDDKLTTMEKRFNEMQSQMQSLVSNLSKLTEQGQVNTVAQNLYSSGILKEGKETINR